MFGISGWVCLINLWYYGGVKILFFVVFVCYFGDFLFCVMVVLSLGFGYKIEFGCSSYLKVWEIMGYFNLEGIVGWMMLGCSVEL